VCCSARRPSKICSRWALQDDQRPTPDLACRARDLVRAPLALCSTGVCALLPSRRPPASRAVALGAVVPWAVPVIAAAAMACPLRISPRSSSAGGARHYSAARKPAEGADSCAKVPVRGGSAGPTAQQETRLTATPRWRRDGFFGTGSQTLARHVRARQGRTKQSPIHLPV
jgi:hypothetical protein